MAGYRKICIIVLCFAAVDNVASTIKDSLHIPEKIIGGVIDMVQSHKNKPTQGQQPTYQYPQYQQWNGQSNYQNQGFQTQPQPQFQGQYQNQGQYNSYQNGYTQNVAQGTNYPQGGNNNNFPQTGNTNFPQSGNNNFPQSGGFANNQGYPAGSGQTFNQGQGSGQYQVVYQNPNQAGQPNNQYQSTQSGYYTQNQSNGQYQSSNSGTNQFQPQPGFVGQGNGSGQSNQGFYGNGQPNGQGAQGPSCICQAFTKPQHDVMADVPEKSEKKEESSKE